MRRLTIQLAPSPRAFSNDGAVRWLRTHMRVMRNTDSCPASASCPAFYAHDRSIDYKSCQSSAPGATQGTGNPKHGHDSAKLSLTQRGEPWYSALHHGNSLTIGSRKLKRGGRA